MLRWERGVKQPRASERRVCKKGETEEISKRKEKNRRVKKEVEEAEKKVYIYITP